MTCHSQLYTEAPIPQPLRTSAATGKPPRWVYLATLAANVHLTDTYFVIAHFRYIPRSSLYLVELWR